MAAASSSAPSGGMAQATFELNNDIVQLDASTLDSIFAYDTEAQRAILRAQPWKSDPHFFTKVRISAVALIKMVMHARSGGIYEIMGLMQGKIDVENRTLYVMDSFALPVEGTETRVNAQNEAYEYMVQYLDDSKQVGRLENVVGWYHSHPGYGCWLSGIDVGTQRTNQQFQDPFVAIVIDPNRTISTGKVDIGAFRTYPEGYVAEGDKQGGVQSVPLDKIEDFGVHAGHYYPLEVEHFKSSLDAKLVDLLWNKYWQSTLAQSPLVTNRAYTTDQIRDLAGKLAQSHPGITTRSSAASNPFPTPPKTDDDKQVQTSPEKLLEQMASKAQSSTLANPAHDARKLAAEANHALLTTSLKSALFLPQ
jgi:COP9 signalosome complex subunit 5